MSKTTGDDKDLLQAKVNLETARAPWRELQRFFASGRVIRVAPEVDLTQVAVAMSCDDAAQIQHWMQAGQVGPVDDDTAKRWYEQNANLWTVVVKPWVVVQER